MQLNCVSIFSGKDRVHFLYLEPLSFSEYLDATGNQNLRRFLSDVKLTDSIDDVIHKKLLELLRIYIIVGGMPAVLNKYLSSTPTTLGPTHPADGYPAETAPCH